MAEHFGIYSASSVHVGVVDSGTQHSSENDSTVGSFTAAASAPELQVVDSVDTVKVERRL